MKGPSRGTPTWIAPTPYAVPNPTQLQQTGLTIGFLPCASIIHYDVPLGTKKPWSEMKGWLPAGLARFRVSQHNMSNPMVELDGDRARSRTYGHLIHFQEKKTGELTPMRHHTVYHDEWIRRSEGWRITHRRLAHIHIDGWMNPDDEIVMHPKPVPTELKPRA